VRGVTQDEDRSGYDGACDALGFMNDGNRYGDGWFHNTPIELKKGRSIWIDLVRCSEQQLGVTAAASRSTPTLFLLPGTGHRLDTIVEASVLTTPDLLAFLRLDDTRAHVLCDLAEHVPNSLNAQASLGLGDIREAPFKRVELAP
jgi:hypothetical protein